MRKRKTIVSISRLRLKKIPCMDKTSYKGMRVEIPWPEWFLANYTSALSFRVEPLSTFTNFLCCFYMWLELSDYGDCSVSVTRLPVCYPDLLGVSCESHVCGCVGRLVIFKERQYSENGDEKSRDHEEISFVKWIVIIPGTNFNKPGTY